MLHPRRSLLAAIKDAIPAQLGGSYRYFTGSLAYVLHRITGIALVVYMFLHILSVTAATHHFWEYDLLVVRYQEPDFKLGELALFAALLFHGINGLRLLLVDFVFDRSHLSRRLFWCFGLLILILFVAGAIPLIFHWNTMPLQQGS